MKPILIFWIMFSTITTALAAIGVQTYDSVNKHWAFAGLAFGAAILMICTYFPIFKEPNPGISFAFIKGFSVIIVLAFSLIVLKSKISIKQWIGLALLLVAFGLLA